MGKVILIALSIAVAFIAGVQFGATPNHSDTAVVAHNQCDDIKTKGGVDKSHIQHPTLKSNNKNEPGVAYKPDNQKENDKTLEETQTAELPIPPDSTLRASAEKFDRWLEEKIEQDPAFNIGGAMREKFVQEERDYAWAEKEENMLSALFFENPHLEGLALHGVECKATQCELQIAVNNLEQANDTTSRLLEALASEQQFRQLVSSPDIQNGITTFYLSRDTKGLSLTSLD